MLAENFGGLFFTVFEVFIFIGRLYLDLHMLGQTHLGPGVDKNCPHGYLYMSPDSDPSRNQEVLVQL